MGVPSWSLSAALNAVADRLVRADDGASARTFPASLRALMAGVRGLSDDRGGALTTGGTANAYTVTTFGGITELRPGLSLLVRVDRANTDEPTLNVDGTGPRPWRDQGGATIVAGSLAKGMFRLAVWDDGLNAWISELPPPAAKPMPPSTLKGNLLGNSAQAQDLSLEALLGLDNLLGAAIDSRLQRASVPESQLTGPFPNPSVHHIVTDPHRHVAGRIVDWGNGRWDYYYRSAYRHHIDYNAEIRAVTTLDEGNTWTQERPVISGTGSDLGGDVGAMLPDGRYALVSPTLRPPDPNNPTVNQNETPTVYIIDANDNVEVVQLTMSNGSTKPGFGVVGFWSGEYRAGGATAVPGIVQFLFYGAGAIYRCLYQNGVFGTLEQIIAARPSGEEINLSEAVIGYAPDGRGYMLIRNAVGTTRVVNGATVTTKYAANEQRRPLVAVFTAGIVNGKETWGTPVETAIPYSSVPPYLVPWRPRQHYLYTRSATQNNVSQNLRGQMVALDIDPVAFIENRGKAGFTQAIGVADWQARLALPAWPHIQGGPTLMRDGTWVLAISYGEAFKLPSRTQGAPCRLAIVTNRASPNVSEFGILQLIGSCSGRPESYNEAMQVWTLGEAKRTHTDLTKRLEACDGVSARRAGNAGGTYVMAADDGVQKVLRWGRDNDPATASNTASMNLMGAIFGEDVIHLRGQWVTFCQLFKPGPGFSSATVTQNVLCTNIVGQKVSSTDGGFDGGLGGGAINSLITEDPASPFAVSTLVPKDRYYSDPFCFYVPLDAWMIAWRLTRVPTGTAGAGDYLDVARAGFVYGDRPTLHKVRPYSDYKERTSRIFQTTYAKGVIPGTANTFGGSLAGRRNTNTPGAEYVRWDYPVPMLAPPASTDLRLLSPLDGAEGMVAAGVNAAGSLVNVTDTSLALTPGGLSTNNATFNGHVVARCPAWAI